MQLVQELGDLDPKDKMTPKVAEALIKRFDEPPTDREVESITKLKHMDLVALRIAASMAGPEAAADEAMV